jgi:hypothetical protein
MVNNGSQFTTQYTSHWLLQIKPSFGVDRNAEISHFLRTYYWKCKSKTSGMLLCRLAAVHTYLRWSVGNGGGSKLLKNISELLPHYLP